MTDVSLAGNPGYNLPSRTPILCAIIAIEVMILCVPAKWWGVAGLSLVVVGVLFALLTVVSAGRNELVILAWILVFPLGYYFLSYPRERSVITLDRVFLVLLLVMACLADRQVISRIPPALRRSGVYWSLFLLFAALAIPRAQTPLNSLRLWFDAFLFPALLAWYTVRYFDARRWIPALHATTCAMAIYVAAIGMGEVVLQQDLLPLPSGGVIVAGDYAGDIRDAATQILIRPNGPFSTVNSFAIVGIVSLFFLLFLRQVMADRMPAWQRILHRLGVAATLAQALMPLFKSVIVSLVVVLLVDAYYQSGSRRILRVGSVLSFGFAFLLLRMALPVVFEERADSVTFYARIAQEKQTLALFLGHPINGVGLNNFQYVAEKGPTTYYDAGEALDSPHNNLGAVLAETGLTGFLPFVVSQVLFVSAFWKLRQGNSSESKLVWKTFLFVFLGFWINGMALTIMYFGDLNLWYMFVLAVLYKFAITSPAQSATGLMTRMEKPS